MAQKSYTDVIFQSVKVFVEGVEIPYNSISISSGYGGLPSANVTVPAQAGLMDIARFYSPKIHIFFSDRHGTYDENDPEDLKRRDKLLFSGVIAQVAYVKSKNVSSNMAISFSCQHRYSLINEMILDFSGWMNADVVDPASTAPGGNKTDHANSPAAIIEALSGITKLSTVGGGITKEAPNGKTSVLDGRYDYAYERIKGMPSVLFNFWNQMKRSAFNRLGREGDKYYSEAFVKIYQPLVEDGLQFFDRIAGHYPIEAMVNDDMNRVDPCPETPNRQAEKILIPPVNQLFLSSSIQAEMAVANISSYLQYSGEMTTIYGIFSQFYDSIDYDMLTLTSPAMVGLHAGGEEVEVTYPVDTVIKPKIPFYISPTCNILFPGMYHHISVMYDEINVPTRVNLKNSEGPGNDVFTTNFRAPHSIRQAIAQKVAGVNGQGGYVAGKSYSLRSTTGPSYGAIGLYEQGRGIKQQSAILPRWLAHFSQSTFGANGTVTDQMPDATKEPNKVEALRQLAAGWSLRYPGDQNKPLNPYAVENSDVSAHHRILFTAADYQYTQAFASSKAGTVECLFNPYIVPGYPMDILEKNPLFPSFHAMCTTVTHNISAEACGTSVQFTGAMTYAELANYYIPFVSPIVQVSLKLAENPTLVGIPQESDAHKTGDDFYRYTLGVPCITPDMLIDFSTMQLRPLQWSDDNTAWTIGSTDSIPDIFNGGELNPILSFEGNLSLVQRPIESKRDIEIDFDIKFIDMTAGNYGPTVIRYQDPKLGTADKFEIGRSQFLTYDSYFGEPILKQTNDEAVPAGSTSTNQNEGTDSSGNVEDLSLG